MVSSQVGGRVFVADYVYAAFSLCSSFCYNNEKIDFRYELVEVGVLAKWSKGKRLWLLVVGAVFLIGVIFSAGGCGNKEQNFSGGAVQLTDADTVADVVDAVGPAVVMISTTADAGGTGNPLFNDPLFRYFFDVPYSERQMEGIGSGFIISKDGYVLTNEHVIDNANEIAVTVTGFEQPLTAKVVGADYYLDLALLKIDVSGELPFLNLGDSDQVDVGSWVIAIGNPYGLDHTVTTGVVSAKGRPATVDGRQYENLLQTDASINPGNSGGPLLNLRGEVIGINTAINEEAQGIGFAIPTGTVQSVLEDLKNGENTVVPWAGVQVRTVDQDAADYLGLEQAEGALVVGVLADSPAQEAGLRQWDVIVEFNGQEISNADELVAVIKAVQVGRQVRVLLVREQQLHAVEITIAERPRNVR